MLFELVAVAVIGCLLYVLLLSSYSPPSYWKQYGIRQIDSSVVASSFEIILGKRSIMHRDDYAYQLMGSSDKFCGMLESPSPVVLVKDLDLIKKIMIKDFDHFVNRRDFFPIDKANILAQTVASLKGEHWKGVRATMSSTFTTGKIRRMMEHFNSVSQEWTNMLKQNCNNSGGSISVDVVKTVTLFTVEVIATAVFGMRSGAMENSEAIFLKKANRLSEINFIDAMKFNLAPRYPKLFEMFKIDVLDSDTIGFFENLLRQSLEARLNGTVERNDFQQLLIEAQKGKLKAVGSDELENFEKDAQLKVSGNSKYITNDVIVANSIVFFIAGLQTTTYVISMAIYVLAAYPDIQDKLRDTIDKMMKEDGNINYDDLGQSNYLDMFFSELLRLYPPATRLEREAERDYHDKETGLFVPKGTCVAVPVHSIHNDPKYFPNPERFDPENFSAERKAERNSYAYMPFGTGPRFCIGQRFALIETKAAVAHLIQRFMIEPTQKTPLPVQTMAAGLQLFTPKDLEVKFTPRK